MNQTVNPHVSEVAEVLAGVSAGCSGEDEDVRECHSTGAGTRHSAQMAVPVEGRCVRREIRSAGRSKFQRRARKVKDLEALVARQSLELDFFKGALQRIEEQRRKREETSGPGSTSKSAK